MTEAVERTYEDCIAFLIAVKRYKAQLNEGRAPEKKPIENKLTYALDRVVDGGLLKKCQRAEQARDRKLQDANIEFASTYPDDFEKKELRGNLIVEDDHYHYTPASDRLRREAQYKAQQELEETKIEFEPYWATKVPADLPREFARAFDGFVLHYEDKEPEDDVEMTTTSQSDSLPAPEGE